MLIISALGDFMETILSAKKYINAFSLNLDSGISEYGPILAGCIYMYDKSKDKAFLDFVKNFIDLVILKNGDCDKLSKDLFEGTGDSFYIGSICIFLYDETGEDKYLDLAKLYYKELCIYLDQNKDCIDESFIKEYQGFVPFYTDYETRWNKKNGYNDICNRFRAASSIFEKDDKTQISLICKLLFLKAVVESLSVLSIQIYEDYRLLEDILRQGIKTLFFEKEDYDQIYNLDDKFVALSSYILLRSIKEGHISSEKYRLLADRLLDRAYDDYLDNIDNIEKEYMGYLFMAEAYK